FHAAHALTSLQFAPRLWFRKGVEFGRVNLAVECEIYLLADRKEDAFAIFRPLRISRAAFVVCHFANAAAVRIHDVNLVAAAPIRSEGDLRAIGRPRRPTIE